jgi:hypothetical protein
MPWVGEWHRPYEVNLLRISLSYLLFLVVVFFCFQGAPFEFEIQRSWWLVLQNPAIDLFLPAALFFGWLSARTGVYVGDIGVMVRVGFRRIVVPWQEIVYAEIAEVPKFPVILPRGPSLGLVLVAPSGQRRPLPARLSAGTLRWGRGSPPHVVLTQEHMTQVVNRINELAAGQRAQAWPPPGEWLFPSHPGSGRRRKATMGRRSRFLLILLGGLILFGTVNSVFGFWRNQPLEIGPPTPKPSANFVPLRPVGDVSMPLEATNADESAFTSSTIVTNAGHPSGVAYMAGWQQGASLRIASLDLASGKPLFPVVDLGAWYRVYQLAARPEGILIAGLKLTPSAHPELVPAELDVHLVALDPSTGHVRWDDRIAHGPEVFAQLYPYGVMAADSLHEPALLDWTTGTPRWTDSGNPSVPGRTDGALPPVTRIEPQLTAPLAAAAELDTSTPDDPRLAVPLDNSAWILDTQTGNWTEVTRGVGGRGAPVLLRHRS